ncbi:MAG TPA: helix-turn-helix domain-containing protein [Thermoanaerobaculia bacterium]
MPKVLPELCAAVGNLRRILGWSSAELAEKLNISPNTLSDYERGQRKLSREKAEELIAPMGLDGEALEAEVASVRKTRERGKAVYPSDPDEEEDERGRVEAMLRRLGTGMAEAFRPVIRTLLVDVRAEADRQLARGYWLQLASRPQEKRLEMVRKSRQYGLWTLSALACAESIKAAADSAQRAVEFAQVAVEIAERVRTGPLFRQRIEGYARFHLANALRVAGDLRRADVTLAKAKKLWSQGEAGDPSLLSEARVLSLEASLRTEQRRPSEAMDLLEQALEIDQGELKANLLIQQAYVDEVLGDYEAAIATLRQAAPLVAQSDRRMQCVLRFNLAGNLCHVKRFSEAESVVGEVRALVVELGNGLDLLRTRWLQGWLAAGLGRRDEAMATLAKVCDDFAELEIAYDALLAALELAVLYLEKGRTAEVKDLAVRLAPLFKAQGDTGRRWRPSSSFVRRRRARRSPQHWPGRLPTTSIGRSTTRICASRGGRRRPSPGDGRGDGGEGLNPGCSRWGRGGTRCRPGSWCSRWGRYGTRCRPGPRGARG